jgi:hypothetical protein
VLLRSLSSLHKRDAHSGQGTRHLVASGGELYVSSGWRHGAPETRQLSGSKFLPADTRDQASHEVLRSDERDGVTRVQRQDVEATSQLGQV